MENNIDNKIKTFFTDNKQEILNDGFSNKVIKNLPKQESSKEWIVILFAILGGVIALFLAIYSRALLKWVELASTHLQDIILISVIAPIVLVIVLLFIDKRETSRFPF